MSKNLGTFLKRQIFVRILLFILVVNYFLTPATAHATTSLTITNAGAESGSTTGWTVTSNGGDGWKTSWDDVVRSGTKSFQTSWALAAMNQTIDLHANGYTQSQLDTHQPTITASQWIKPRHDQNGRYYILYRLIGTDGTTVKATSGSTFGTSSSLLSIVKGTDWTEKVHVFSSYGTDVRYVYIEIGGRDTDSWAGNYGTHFDDTSVTVATIDVTAPTISQVASVSSPTTNVTPTYTFTTDEAGTITYGGSCQSTTTSATSGSNTITLNSLAVGSYSNCTITVTDSLGNISSTLTISPFTIGLSALPKPIPTPPVLSGVYPNGGETFVPNSNKTITWYVGGNTPYSISILLSTNGGASYDTVVATNPIAEGQYIWTIPRVSTNNARIRVRALVNGVVKSTVDSAGDFSIIDPQQIRCDKAGQAVVAAEAAADDAHKKIVDAKKKSDDAKTALKVAQVNLDVAKGVAPPPSVDAYNNLLANPGAELGNFSGWNKVDGGSGWAVTNNEYFRSGARGFVSSYSFGTLSQEIDLAAAGYSASAMDLQPIIDMGTWVMGYGNGSRQDDPYQVKVVLRNAKRAAVATYDTGIQNTTENWVNIAHTFRDYGVGVRYIYFELRGKDSNRRSGQYGSVFDDSSVVVKSAAATPAVASPKISLVDAQIAFDKAKKISDEADNGVATATAAAQPLDATLAQKVADVETLATSCTDLAERIKKDKKVVDEIKPDEASGCSAYTGLKPIPKELTKTFIIGNSDEEIKLVRQFLNINGYKVSPSKNLTMSAHALRRISMKNKISNSAAAKDKPDSNTSVLDGKFDQGLSDALTIFQKDFGIVGESNTVGFQTRDFINAVVRKEIYPVKSCPQIAVVPLTIPADVPMATSTTSPDPAQPIIPPQIPVPPEPILTLPPVPVSEPEPPAPPIVPQPKTDQPLPPPEDIGVKPPTSPLPWSNIVVGSSGDGVKTLCSFLGSNGFSTTGSCDVFDDKLQKSLTKFQEKFTDKGELGLSTVKLLNDLIRNPPIGSCNTSHFTLLPPEKPFTRPLKFGDKGDDVRVLQKFLNDNGFLLGTSGPGALGEETQNFIQKTQIALRYFQNAYGLISEKGTIGPNNLLFINNLLPNPPVLNCPKLIPAAEILDRDLQLNDRGQHVQVVQSFLNANGFLLNVAKYGSPSQETIFFGPYTRAAVTRFQIAFDLRAEKNKVGPLTRDFINQLATRGKAATPTGKEVLATEMIRQSPSPKILVEQACVPLLITYMRIGLSNDADEVRKLQNFLRDREGFAGVVTTGIFDGATQKAIVSFQQKYSKEVLGPWSAEVGTGYVFKTTIKKINELNCASN